MIYRNLIAEGFDDYELLDSGNNRKLERFGSELLIRPETQALWQPHKPKLWDGAAGEFIWKDGKGVWKGKGILSEWMVSWNKARFLLKPTSFKHIGIFPEQASNWEWIAKCCAALDKPEVLNLFGYTGAASIVAAQHGAVVTHVDASKQSNTWAKENASASNIMSWQIRFLLDDALKFVMREVRRGKKYDGIILDPPAFGRGPKGEVWHIEEDLPKLINALKELLASRAGSFLLLNGYAAGYSPYVFKQLIDNTLAPKEGEFGELQIIQKGSDIVLPSGIYARFIR